MDTLPTMNSLLLEDSRLDILEGERQDRSQAWQSRRRLVVDGVIEDSEELLDENIFGDDDESLAVIESLKTSQVRCSLLSKTSLATLTPVSVAH